MKAKVSVIIPAYNSQNFIAHSIQSVIAQKHDNLEIIVIDDGSTDATAEVVKNLSHQYPQIFLYQNKRTKGPSGARNTGLEKATGQYIAFLDSDDIWHPNHLEGIQFLEGHPDIGLVFFNFHITNYHSKQTLGDWFSQKKGIQELKRTLLSDDYYLITDDIFSALIKDAFMHLQSMIVRKSACQDVFFDEKITRSEDRDFAVRLIIERNIQIALKDIITGIYYLHGENMTSPSSENTETTLKAHIYLFEKYIQEYALTREQSETLKSSLHDRYLSICYTYRNMKAYKQANRAWMAALKYGFQMRTLHEASKTVSSYFFFIASRALCSSKKQEEMEEPSSHKLPKQFWNS